MDFRIHRNKTENLKAAVLLLLSLSSATAGRVWADSTSQSETLIRETERVRSGLSANDPVRGRLSFRLADLYFDRALELSRNPEAPAAELQQASRNRQQAIALYQECLAASNGAQKAKVQFQLARLFNDQGDTARADALWQELLSQTFVSEIQREAAMRLAEGHEQSGDLKRMEKALPLYDLVLRLCASGDTCSYAHYRKAWIHYKKQEAPLAIAEIEQSLFDSKNQPRDEAIRDYLMFLASVPGEAASAQALQKIDALAQRLSRPQLLSELAEGYYAAGNKREGTSVLEFTNSREPRIQAQVRLLEEYYGLRDWDHFRRMSGDIAASLPAAQQTLASDASNQAASEKIMRRVLIQLDAERISQPAYAVEFRGSVDLYLGLFPSSPERKRFMEGWLAAETDSASKVSKLRSWIVTANAADRVIVREWLAGAAQKSGDSALLAEQMGALAQEVPAKAREYRYSQARAYYGAKQSELAYPIFSAIAQPGSWAGQKPDNWAVQSQNLALDILAQKKDYASLIHQAALWTANAELRAASAADAKFASELADMVRVQNQARFEEAVAMGEKPAALDRFRELAHEGLFTEKALENARVLAVKLGNQAALLETLAMMGPSHKTELTAEYEAAAYFEKAAALQVPTDVAQSLRTALLFELDGKISDRDRVLKASIAQLRAAKKWSSPQVERLAIFTWRQAELLDASLLKFSSTPELRAELAELLESSNQSSPEIVKILLASKQSTGPYWDVRVMEEIEALDTAQAKIGFYGKQGQRKFEARLASLRKLVNVAESRLPQLNPSSRVETLKRLAKVHRDLSETILSSPIPSGIPAETVAQVKASLLEMAQPFQTKSDAYAKLGVEAMPAQPVAAVAADLVKIVQAGPIRVTGITSPIRAQYDRLHAQPEDRVALAAVRDLWKQAGQPRLAAYFEGRLKKEGQQ